MSVYELGHPRFEEAIIESIPSSILIINRALEVVYVNEHYLIVSMKRKRDVLGKRIDKVLPRLTFERMDLNKKISDVFKTGFAFEGGHAPGERLGKIYFYKLRPLRNEFGDVTNLLILIEDVTELTRLEEELKESYRKLGDAYEEVKSAAKARSDFVSVVSHELRTPLTVIHSYLSMLREGLLGGLSNGQIDKIGIALSQTNHMISIINELLDVSKMEAKRFVISKGEISLPKIVKESVKKVERLADIKGHGISVNMPKRFPRIPGDEQRISQALINLLTNAIKYTNDGGKICIAVEDKNSYVQLMVSDTGIGIPKREQGKIFERFYTPKGSSLRRESGRMGLGLSIAKGIIEAHHGKIWVESEVGKGSKFYFILPKKKVQKNIKK
ncbi:MAG: ATP-binding protein [Candidatus Thermoplasmatota archaeon]